MPSSLGLNVAVVDPESAVLERRLGANHQLLKSGMLSDKEIAQFFEEDM